MAPVPPPLRPPFSSSKPQRRRSWSPSDRPYSVPESITFYSDSEKYDEIPDTLPGTTAKGDNSKPNTGTNKSTASRRGVAKKDHVLEKGRWSDATPDVNVHGYKVAVRSKSSQVASSTQRTQDTQKTQSSSHTKKSQQTREPHRSRNSSNRSTVPKPPPSPPPRPQISTSTLVGSAYERRLNDVDSIKEKPDTSARLQQLRKLMAKDALDFYVVPSEDPHQSECATAEIDKRREFISGFSGSAGQAIVSKTCGYLIIDSRYWLQAQEQLDNNWALVRVGSAEGPKDWIEWLVGRGKGARIGIDARMLSLEKASHLNMKLRPFDSKLIYPPQNLVDVVWTDRPARAKEPVYEQGIEFTGMDVHHKLTKLREWIRQQPASTTSFSRNEPTSKRMHVGTLITSLSCIAYVLNLRGSDTLYNTLFHAYLFVGLDTAIIFIDSSKVNMRVTAYLETISVERKDYNDIWPFLRRRGWGEGKLLIAPQTSYAISLVLTRHRYTITPDQVEHMMAIKNGTEVSSMRRAHLRGGISFVRFLAWLDNKLSKGYDITEYEASARLTTFARSGNNFIGFTHDHISASGPNAALPRYAPRESLARMIGVDGLYLIGAGIQYRDGTCEITRTTHFGRPAAEQSDAYTRLLQAHIAMASAVFMEGTSSDQLAILSHKALSQSGLDFMHGSERAGIFLTVRDSPRCFSGNVPLMAGHIVSIEPSLYYEDKWGICVQSSYVVRRIKTQDDPDEDALLGFDRLTCVPIQTRMVKESMLTKAERAWLKDHNQRCQETLSPWLLDDKQALSWVKRESSSGFGFSITPAGPSIEWASE